MAETTTRMIDGAEYILCAAHQLESCHRCCMDFSHFNEEAREDALARRAVEIQADAPDRLGYLPKDCEIIQTRFDGQPCRRRLGVVRGVVMEDDEFAAMMGQMLTQSPELEVYLLDLDGDITKMDVDGFATEQGLTEFEVVFPDGKVCHSAEAALEYARLSR